MTTSDLPRDGLQYRALDCQSESLEHPVREANYIDRGCHYRPYFVVTTCATIVYAKAIKLLPMPPQYG